MFKPVSSKLDVPAMEEGVLNFWEREQIFKKTSEQSQGRPEYVFYEGPPTANGRPGVHHVLARAFKDMFPRYKIMRGFHVRAAAAGIPMASRLRSRWRRSTASPYKHQIEEMGIAKFNEECRSPPSNTSATGAAHRSHRLLGGPRRCLRDLH